jgi:hypothetical protein
MTAVRALRIAVFLLTLLAAAGASPVRAQAPVPATEQDLATLLDAAEARYEEAGGRLADALWRRATGEPAAEADVARARRDLLAAFTEPRLIATLQDWHYRRTVTRDPTLTRRVAIWNQAAPAAVVELDPEITALADRLLSTVARHRYTLDGRDTDQEALRAVLSGSDDEALRRRAWLALLAPGRHIAPDLKRLNRMRAVKARDLRAPTYFDLIYGANEMDSRWLTMMLHTVNRRVRAAAADLDARLGKAVGKPAPAPWDYDRGMAILAARSGAEAIGARRFAAAGGIAALSALGRMMGLPAAAVATRRARAPIAGLLEEILPLIPGDFSLLTRHEPDAPAGGPDGYAMLLSAGAGALQAHGTRVAAPMLKGYDWVPGTRNAIYSRAREEMLAEFLRDPGFLKQGLGMTAEEIAVFLADRRDRALMRLRWIGVNMSMEHVMFLNPDADLDLRYRESFRNITGFSLDPGDPLPWTAEPRFIARPVSWFADLTALSVAADAHHLIHERFGADPLAGGKLGPWLIETCYASGESVPLQKRIADSLQAGFDFRRYLESLGIEQPPRAP